ncbi:phosphotransferase [Paramicrobacterium fandaimingii]|uniref:phosphotransferase n=1 Tax=Paramicrobacterium fandaimingii TaxID=2708079 RepID=UPI00141FBC85|nr:phosphotransferase [Microbacterium fandaimingii]
MGECRNDSKEEELAGGVANAGAVVRVDNEVRRPLSAHSPAVWSLQSHLAVVGCPAPQYLGVDDAGRERLSFIEGEVGTPPFPQWVTTDHALQSTVELLRRTHDATRDFRDSGLPWNTEFAHPDGGPVIGHNDVCPENVVFRNGDAYALIDFDHAAPTHPLLDLAHLTRMWAPLGASDDPIDQTQRIRARVRLIVETYGVTSTNDLQYFFRMCGLSVVQAERFVCRRLASEDRISVNLWGHLRESHFVDQRRSLEDAVRSLLAE